MRKNMCQSKIAVFFIFTYWLSPFSFFVIFSYRLFSFHSYWLSPFLLQILSNFARSLERLFSFSFGFLCFHPNFIHTLIHSSFAFSLIDCFHFIPFDFFAPSFFDFFAFHFLTYSICFSCIVFLTGVCVQNL